MRNAGGRRLLRFVLLATVSVLAVSGATVIAAADVPDVLQIEDISQGSMGKIRLQIRHLNPSASHYIDMVEADISGQVSKYSLQPQSTNPFTVELDLGQFQGKPNVKARAHCIIHGWSAWSNQIQIPEFSNVGAMLLAAMATSFLIGRRSRRK